MKTETPQKRKSPDTGKVEGAAQMNEQAHCNRFTHLSNAPHNSIISQRSRLLEALITTGNVTTYEARGGLNIVSPAARIIELRRMGHEIHTSRETLPDGAGRLHPRSARYVLIALANEVKQ